MAEKPPCRALTFADLDAVIQDVVALHERGYLQAGNWDLAQTCGHLAHWMRFPLDGYPAAPLPLRWFLWTMRMTVGKRTVRRILAAQSMPSAVPTLKETIPPQGGDERAAVAQFREIIARFQTHAGPLHPSPVFGTMDVATAMQLQLIHCAHHLRNLVPRAEL